MVLRATFFQVNAIIIQNLTKKWPKRLFSECNNSETAPQAEEIQN
jgi:hypothetical protein